MKRTSATVLAVLAVLLTSSPAHALSNRAADEHCIVLVVGQEPDGELIVSEPECYSSVGEAMASADVDSVGLAAASFVIGTHYDGAGFTGASMSVVGSSCGGGWLNLSAAWDNRISSTLNGCPRIRHYAGINLTGSSQQTFSPGGNLTTLNNLSSSIQYLT